MCQADEHMPVLTGSVVVAFGNGRLTAPGGPDRAAE
jgi:hypothetical protein